MFQEKGFLKTSMRDIAECSRLGLSNTYNYFKGKDEIFRRVVSPVTRAFETMLHEHHGRQGADILEMQSEAYFRHVVEEYIDLIHRHRPCWYCCSFVRKAPRWRISRRSLPIGLRCW